MLSKCGVGEESSLNSEELIPVNDKGNQPWIFIGRSEAESLAVWPPDAKSRLIGKDPDSGKDWGQEKEVIEDKVIGWNQWLNRHEFKQTLGDTEGQGSLVCCRPWVTKNRMCLSEWTTTTRNPSVIEETIVYHSWKLITYLTCLFSYMLHCFSEECFSLLPQTK